MGVQVGKWFRNGVRLVGVMVLALIALGGLSGAASATLPGKNGPLLISSFIKPAGSLNYSTYLYTETSGGKAKKVLGGADSYYDGAVSPDGNSLVFSRYPGYQLWLGSFSHPGKARAITPAIEGTNFGESVFAPDGKSIYYSSKVYSNSGTSYEIRKYTIKTKKSRTFKLKKFVDSGLSGISPNGRLLAFTRGTDEDKTKIWFLDTKTGKSWAPKLKTPGIGASLLPDGKSIVYTAPVKKGWEVFTARLNGKGVKRLTRGVKINFSPVYSPDGRQVAFTQGDDATRRIGIVNLKTGKTKYFAAPGDYTEVNQWLGKG